MDWDSNNCNKIFRINKNFFVKMSEKKKKSVSTEKEKKSIKKEVINKEDNNDVPSVNPDNKNINGDLCGNIFSYLDNL